ncbi:MAG: hypothetical protein KBC84_04810 [Proteobacteria bacterium]|nr:hypothetical protein [Pseudomonadota bacterium]
MKNKLNFQLSIAIALIFLLSTIIYAFLEGQEEMAGIQTENNQELIDKDNSTKTAEIPAPENHRQTALEVPENINDNKESASEEIPEDLQNQAKSLPKDLPEDLKEQAKEQTDPNDLPEDIKRSMEIPSREVSIDEVNNPNNY